MVSSRNTRIVKAPLNVCKVGRRAWSPTLPALGAIALFFFSPPSIMSAGQSNRNALLEDNSDWWSLNSSRSGGKIMKDLQRDPGDSHFQIAGVNLTGDTFQDAAQLFGPTQIVERDNVSSYRRKQACYVSQKGTRKVYLIFEDRHDDFGTRFYLFFGGPDWNGINLCVPSDRVSSSLSTPSGLHLGQSYSDVLAILGKPSVQENDKLTYSFHSVRKTSPEDFATWLKANPLLSEEELHKTYGSYDFEPSIEARFLDSKLIYLAVLKALFSPQRLGMLGLCSRCFTFCDSRQGTPSEIRSDLFLLVTQLGRSGDAGLLSFATIVLVALVGWTLLRDNFSRSSVAGATRHVCDRPR
jgi:hypothetical protein